jgi:hypothetical protein
MKEDWSTKAEMTILTLVQNIEYNILANFPKMKLYSPGNRNK